MCIRDSADAERWMHGEDLRLMRDVDHRQQDLGVVIAELEDVWGARGIVVGDEDRIAVRRTLHRRVHADGAAGAGAVLDKELLAESLRQNLRALPRDEIDGAARRQ